MRLNRLEKAMMNNPVRAAFQRHVEATCLLDMGGRMTGGTALEVGCGRGVGIRIILDLFGARRVDAFDLDLQMVQIAGAKLVTCRDTVRLWSGDAAAISVADAAYDAVFDFGIIHHVPDWRTALDEIFRVLKPGGRFYAEEVLKAFILNPLVRRLFLHPLDDRFDHRVFREGLENAGFRIIGSKAFMSSVGWFVADKPA